MKRSRRGGEEVLRSEEDLHVETEVKESHEGVHELEGDQL